MRNVCRISESSPSSSASVAPACLRFYQSGTRSTPADSHHPPNPRVRGGVLPPRRTAADRPAARSQSPSAAPDHRPPAPPALSHNQNTARPPSPPAVRMRNIQSCINYRRDRMTAGGIPERDSEDQFTGAGRIGRSLQRWPHSNLPQRPRRLVRPVDHPSRTEGRTECLIR